MADSGGGADEDLVEVTVWDAPTRAFKWALVAAVSAAYVLGDEMDFDTVSLHFYAGYSVLGLVMFRLFWGLRPSPSHLGHLVPSLKTTVAYARTALEPEPSRWPGHAPLGGWASAALLATLVGVTLTGMCSTAEDFFEAGPLAPFVGERLSALAGLWHERLVNLLLALVALHILAVGFYAVWKREDLIGPMIGGKKLVRRRPEDADARD